MLCIKIWGTVKILFYKTVCRSRDFLGGAGAGYFLPGAGKKYPDTGKMARLRNTALLINFALSGFLYIVYVDCNKVPQHSTVADPGRLAVL